MTEQPPDGHPSRVVDLAELWNARPMLRHLHDFARARSVAPLALLGVVLLQGLAATSPQYVLPPLVGGVGSLNHFLNLTGDSGAGKGATWEASADAVDLTWKDPISGEELEPVNVGSGEGLLAAFAEWQRGPGVVRVAESVAFYVAEVDHLTAVSSRSGATLLGMLREAWSGGMLGSQYGDRAKRLHIRRHSYRCVMVVGVQPSRAAPLLDDADGGTPQRFLWLPTTDPDAPRRPPAEPATPAKVRTVALPPPTSRRIVVKVCDEAREAILDARADRLRGVPGASDLDAHRLLAQEKVAAGFAILAGHLGSDGITAEDWRLAGLLMAVSDATRRGVQDVLGRQAAEVNTARGKAEAAREVMKTEAVETAAVQRVGQRITSKLDQRPGEWVRGADLRRSFTNDDRGRFDVVLPVLVASGQVEVEESEYHGQPSRRYRRRPS